MNHVNCGLTHLVTNCKYSHRSCPRPGQSKHPKSQNEKYLYSILTWEAVVWRDIQHPIRKYTKTISRVSVHINQKSIQTLVCLVSRLTIPNVKKQAAFLHCLKTELRCGCLCWRRWWRRWSTHRVPQNEIKNENGVCVLCIVVRNNQWKWCCATSANGTNMTDQNYDQIRRGRAHSPQIHQFQTNHESENTHEDLAKIHGEARALAHRTLNPSVFELNWIGSLFLCLLHVEHSHSCSHTESS